MYECYCRLKGEGNKSPLLVVVCPIHDHVEKDEVRGGYQGARETT